MAIFDQIQPLADTDALSAGQLIRFEAAGICVPFATPDDSQVLQAFAQSAPALQITQIGNTVRSNAAPGGYSKFIYASIVGAVGVGIVRAQILGAFQQLNNLKAIPCSLSINGSEIDLVVDLGTGAPDVGTTAVVTFAAIAALGILVFIFWKARAV